jgi:hypothetical protein
LTMSTEDKFRPNRDSLSTGLTILIVLGLFAALGIPNRVGHGPGKIRGIIHNLRQLDGAVQQWACVRGYTNRVPVTPKDIAPYVIGGWVNPIAGERYALRYYPQSPEAFLNCDVEGHPKGTIISFTTNGFIFLTPK